MHSIFLQLEAWFWKINFELLEKNPMLLETGRGGGRASC